MLNELVITARSVLKDVVKLIHFSLRELVLRSNIHPLSLMIGTRIPIYTPPPPPTRTHLPSEKLEDAFVACYPSLNSESKREICQMMVEALFFPAILPPLLMVYRCRHYQEELATAKNMCYHANVTPKDLSVRRKFWLAEQVQVDNGLGTRPSTCDGLGTRPSTCEGLGTRPSTCEGLGTRPSTCEGLVPRLTVYWLMCDVGGLIGVSLSEPHTSGTAWWKCVCIHTCLFACLLACLHACMLAAIYRKF